MKNGSLLDYDGRREGKRGRKGGFGCFDEVDLTCGRHQRNRIEWCASGTNAKQSEKTTMQEFDGLFSPTLLSSPEEEERPERSVGWRFHFISIHGSSSLSVSSSGRATNESIYQTKGRGKGGERCQIE